MSDSESRQDPKINLFTAQFLSLLRVEDIDSLEYLLESIVPQIQEFWDSVAYLQLISHWMRSTGFFESQNSTLQTWFREQIITQLNFCQQYIMENSKFELMWILPYLKLFHAPETLPGDINFAQELANFLETPLKEMPSNFGTFLVEIVMNLVAKAHASVIQRKETGETLRIFHKWLDNFVRSGMISQSQHDYITKYITIWFPISFKDASEKETWIRQSLKVIDKINDEITDLLPFERLRIKLLQSKFMLELAQISQTDQVSLINTLLRLTNEIINKQYIPTGLLLDYTLLLATRIETLQIAIKLKIGENIEEYASEGASKGLILVHIFDLLEPMIGFDIGLRLIGPTADFVNSLKNLELKQACQTIMLILDQTIKKGEVYLTEPSTLSGELFKNLAISFLALISYPLLEARHKERALRDAQEYNSQAIAIFDLLQANIEATEARIIAIKIGLAQIKLLNENNASNIEILAVVMETLSEIKNVITKIFFNGLLTQIPILLELIMPLFKEIKLKAPEKENEIAQIITDIQTQILNQEIIENYPEIIKKVKTLKDF